jgi:hypothetical protein
MPSELNFIGDTRPLVVDEDPAEVGTRFGSGGRLGSTKTVVELHTGGRPVYVNPASVTFFGEGEVRGPSPAQPLAEGPGFGRP